MFQTPRFYDSSQRFVKFERDALQKFANVQVALKNLEVMRAIHFGDYEL